MGEKDKKNWFPHTNTGVLKPVDSFKIGERWLYLYTHKNKQDSGAPYYLYWENEEGPLKYDISFYEVFTILSNLINSNNATKEYRELRQDLKQLLSDYGIRSNPAVDDEWIILKLREILEGGAK